MKLADLAPSIDAVRIHDTAMNEFETLATIFEPPIEKTISIPVHLLDAEAIEAIRVAVAEGLHRTVQRAERDLKAMGWEI